jgi:hypothetical protein
MKGHCACVATGLSSHAIAYAFGHCASGNTGNHPWDPADLKRCVDYCEETGISTRVLAKKMAPVSPTWAVLVAEWDSLAASLAQEMTLGDTAPRTYQRMRQLREIGMAADMTTRRPAS